MEQAAGIRKLSFIETCVWELRELSRPSELRTDIRQQRFTLRTLQICIQATLDLARLIVANERLGEPRTRRELFGLLAQRGWIPVELAASLERLTKLRNTILYKYERIDLVVIEDVIANHLDDFLAFTKTIRGRLSSA